MARGINDCMEVIGGWVEDGRLSGVAADMLRLWLHDPAFSEFRDELLASVQSGKTDELEDQFRTRIEFGTGGIRGTMGLGPNRINVRTIGEAAQGLAQYVLQSGGDNAAERGVVIACDTRHNSDVYARETAAILAANGIRVHLFRSPRATPQLSFAVRDRKAVAGVVISASHNPPSDNGFKVYWSDGGQVVPPHDRNIINLVRQVTEIARCDFEEALNDGLVRWVDEGVDERYRATLGRLTLSDSRDVSIVFTPLHGVGMTSVGEALTLLGYTDLRVVPEQAVQDGDFPTVAGGVANPESPNSFALAIREAAATGADLALASDPDADRFGCAVPDRNKGWAAPASDLALNGNQIGAILCHYILSSREAQGSLPGHGLVCQTVVTTDLVGVIARSFGMDVIDDLLIGFKYIGAAIEAMSAEQQFVFGTEESHGYLADPAIRDKEAATGVLLVECAAALKSRGKTLRDYLDEIYRTYGYFQQVQTSTYREGAEGSREITAIMDGLRENPPLDIGGRQVHEVIDRLNGVAVEIATGAVRDVPGEKGNLLIYTFSADAHTRVAVRPSGTEPKIKFYISASTLDNPGLLSDDWHESRAVIDDLADEIVTGILAAAEHALSAR